MRPKAPRVGDKGETSVNSCGPRNPDWETSVGDKCGRQVGDKCKLMRPKAPKCGKQGKKKRRQVQTHAAQGTQSGRQVWETNVGDRWETSVNSCGPRHPDYTTLQDITLHYTPVHHITLHYTPVRSTILNYTTPHYTTLHYTTSHYTTLHYTILHYLPLHFTTLHYTTLHYTTTTTTTTQLDSTTLH